MALSQLTTCRYPAPPLSLLKNDHIEWVLLTIFFVPRDAHYSEMKAKLIFRILQFFSFRDLVDFVLKILSELYLCI